MTPTLRERVFASTVVALLLALLGPGRGKETVENMPKRSRDGVEGEEGQCRPS